MSWESSSFRLTAAVRFPSSRRCLCWVVVTGWGGAEAKAFACLQADDGDAFRRRFPRWRHHSFAPSPPSPPMAGRLIGGSFCVPALLHFTQCRLRCLGRGGCCAAQLRCLLLLADGGSLALADALPPYSCSLVDALPPVVTSSLADALSLFLYSQMLCRRGRAIRSMLHHRLVLRAALSWHLWG